MVSFVRGRHRTRPPLTRPRFRCLCGKEVAGIVQQNNVRKVWLYKHNTPDGKRCGNMSIIRW